MAALSLACSFLTKKSSYHQEMKSKNCPRLVILLAGQSPEPVDDDNNNDNNNSISRTRKKKEVKGNNNKVQPFSQFVTGLEKIERGLKENLSPRQKGDWKDLVLMSLSFAVYVYISQMIVCAYFAWMMSMPKPSW